MDENKANASIELREMKAELGLLSKSDGSAIFSQGITTMLVSVFGPVEVKLQNLNIEKASIEVYYRPKSGLMSVDDRFKENFVHQCIETALYSELHPRTAYKIQLQEVEDRGGVLACAINATCLALLNSGLELKFMIAAVYCVLNESGEIIVDPNLWEQDRPVATFTFVFDSLVTKSIAVHTVGKFTMEQYQQAMDLCRGSSEKIFKFYREILSKTTVAL